MQCKKQEAATTHESLNSHSLPTKLETCPGRGLLLETSITCSPAGKHPKVSWRWPLPTFHLPKLSKCFLLVGPNLFSYPSCKGVWEIQVLTCWVPDSRRQRWSWGLTHHIQDSGDLWKCVRNNRLCGNLAFLFGGSSPNVIKDGLFSGPFSFSIEEALSLHPGMISQFSASWGLEVSMLGVPHPVLPLPEVLEFRVSVFNVKIHVDESTP